MIDKFGRSIVAKTVNGEEVYEIGGRFSISVTTDDVITEIERVLPSVTDYTSKQCDFDKYVGVLTPDFENSIFGGLLKAKLLSSIESAKDQMRSKIFRMYEKRMEEVFELYPMYEPLGWPIKKMQATQWLTMDNTARDAAMATYPDPLCQFRMLFAESHPTTTTLVRDQVTELASKIYQNGYVFEQYYGEITGYKTDLIRNLNEAESVEDIINLDIAFSAIPSLTSRFS